MRQRNPSIDILKFFAALLITNSHMGMLYPDSGQTHQIELPVNSLSK